MVFTEAMCTPDALGFKRKFDRRKNPACRRKFDRRKNPACLRAPPGGLRAGTLLDHYTFVFGHHRLPGHAAVQMSRCRSGQARAAGLLAARADRAHSSPGPGGPGDRVTGRSDATGPGPPAPCCI